MANSLIPDRPVTTSQVQRFNLSGGEIAAPFNDLARAVDATAGAAETAAEKLAVPAGEEAGRKSVRTADDGSLVVDDTSNPFIIGKAGAAYERAAKMTQAAQIAPRVETDMLQLRLDHPNDPGGFKAAATAYSQKTLAGINDPHIKNAVGDMLVNSAEQNERSVLVQANAHNTAEYLQSQQAAIKDTTEKMSLLARQGAASAPTDSNAFKEFQARAHDLAAIYKGLGDDPRVKFSPERAKLELDEHYAGFKVQEKIGEEQRKFQADPNKDLLKAKQSLYDAFWGPGAPKNLTVAQRDHGFTEGVRAIQNTDAIDREARDENRKNVAAWLADSVHRPGSFNLGAANDLKQHAENIGDGRSAREIDERIKWQPFWASFGKAPPHEQSEMLDQMQRGIYPAFRLQSNYQTMLDAAPPEIRAGLSVRSGFRTGAQQQQLFDAAVKKYGSEEEARKWVAPPGHSQHEKGAAVDLTFANEATRQWVHDYVKSNPGAGLTFPLGNEPWHMELAGARDRQEGAPLDRTTSAATGRIFEMLTKEGETIVSKNAQTAYDRIEKIIKEGGQPRPDDVQDFARMADLSGKRELREKAEKWLGALDTVNGLAPGTTKDVLQAKVAAADATGASAYEHDMYETAVAVKEASDKALASNPRAWGAARGMIGDPKPFDFTNPAAVGANLAARDKDANVLHQQVPNLGVIPALTPDEAPRFAAALTQGDPKVAGDLLGQMQVNLMKNPDVWRATMAMPAVKEAVLGMLRSNDPVRMDAGGRALDALWAGNEPKFAADYGKPAVERLMAWKALAPLGSEERTKRMQLADDPSTAKSREDIAQATVDSLKSTSAADVAYQVSNAWPIISHLMNPITHQFLRPPAIPGGAMGEEGVAAGQLRNDFVEMMKQLRMHDVPAATAPTYAAQALKSEWQPSPMLGNALMKHAPEHYYPADPIGGGHKWMEKQLEDEIIALHGPRETPISGGDFESGGMGATMAPGWRLKSIIADNQTNQEIESGNPKPSYQIHIIDAKGQDQIVGGLGKRYFWDQARMLNQRQSEMNEAGNRYVEPMRTLGQGSPFMSRLSNPPQPNAMDH